MFYHFSRDSFITHLTRNGPLFYRTTATKKQPSLGNVSPINLLTLVPICKYRKRTWKLFTDLSESLFSVSLVGLRSAAVFDIKMFVVLILWLESGAGDWATLSTSRLVDWDSPQPAGQQPHTQTSPTLCQGQHLPPFNQLSVLGHWRHLIHPFLPKSLSGEYKVGVTPDDWGTTLGTGAPFVPHWSLECWSQILSRRQKAAALIYLAPLNWLNFSFFPLL